MTGLTENRAVLETKSEFEETSLGKKYQIDYNNKNTRSKKR